MKNIDWRDDECEFSNVGTNDKLWQDSWDDDELRNFYCV